MQLSPSSLAPDVPSRLWTASTLHPFSSSSTPLQRSLSTPEFAQHAQRRTYFAADLRRRHADVRFPIHVASIAGRFFPHHLRVTQRSQFLASAWP